MTIFRLSFEHAAQGDTTVQTITLDAKPQPASFPAPVRIFTEFPGRRLAPPTVLDGPLFSTLMIAMRQGATVLEIEGPISAAALRNAQAFQEAFVSMLPRYLGMVEIAPREVVAGPRACGEAAIMAFSGGLDCTFSLIRHARKLLGHGSYAITHALMVHGLDVRLRHREAFRQLCQRVTPLLDELGVELIVARSNVRNPVPHAPKVQLQPYGFSQAAQIAGIFHALAEDRFAHGVIGATEPYRNLLMPWGTNPATDYLLSNAGFGMVHDGAAFVRCEKAAVVAEHPTALRTLRVCLGQVGGNCGVCEKCVRTRLNLMAVGVDNPPCFDQPFHLDMIEAIQLWHPRIQDEAAATVAYAEAAGLSAPWLDRLRDRIAAMSAERPAAP